MAVFSVKVKELVATEVIEFRMYENKYTGGHETTYSIVKWNNQRDDLIEWVVRNVRRDTAEMVWRDRVDDTTWVHGSPRR